MTIQHSADMKSATATAALPRSLAWPESGWRSSEMRSNRRFDRRVQEFGQHHQQHRKHEQQPLERGNGQQRGERNQHRTGEQLLAQRGLALQRMAQSRHRVAAGIDDSAQAGRALEFVVRWKGAQPSSRRLQARQMSRPAS
jgi:hypothetical protein